jgi:NADH:ubiquinone oxidoreductase subunit E/ferredoxin
VTEDGETREFSVKGGDYLHTCLSENGVKVSSSCGGKATCGYCKVRVLDGGGPILPTEEIFMSRQEKREGMRLACQVKVKEDLSLEIPDFLTTVRNMVKHHTFDTKITWRVKVDGNVPESPPGGKKKLAVKLTSEDEHEICGIIEEYRDPSGSVVPIMQQINKKYNYLPEDFLRFVSDHEDVPLSILFRLASFYNAFSLEPRGKYTLTVCTGTACHVKGAGRLVEMLEDELGIRREETTQDQLFTLKTVRCVGCCGLAPVVVVGDQVHGAMNAKKTMKVVEECRPEAGAGVSNG